MMITFLEIEFISIFWLQLGLANLRKFSWTQKFRKAQKVIQAQK